MIATVQEYMDSTTGEARDWLAQFYGYMHDRHGEIQPVMFRQRPMFKIGKSYVMFTAAKSHFSVHTMNFELIEEYRRMIPGSGNAKGCLNIKYANTSAIPLLKELCDKVVEQNRLPNAPAPGAAAQLSYGEHMERVFAASKAGWRPLYEQLRDMAKRSLPDFIEYFPAQGILWKHTVTFAAIRCKKDALQIEFYADRLHEDRRPVKHQKTSANRVAHTVEFADDGNFDSLITWIRESYLLTAKK